MKNTIIRGRLDHIAISLQDHEQLVWWTEMLERAGGKVIEKPTLRGADGEVRWIAAVGFGKLLLALVAPGCESDGLGRFNAKVPKEAHAAVHHLAFKVTDVELALVTLEATASFTRLCAPIYDPKMDQVFAKSREGQIFELVRRSPGFAGTFLDRNIAALATSERSGR